MFSFKNIYKCYLECRKNKRNTHNGLDFLGYIIRPNYALTRRRVVNNFKYKKAKYLDKYESEKGEMGLEEIREFLSIQASFVGHIKHANSFKLNRKVGKFDDEKYINLTLGEWSGG